MNADRENGAVVLVHGWAAPRAVMKPLERALRPRYDQVTNWGYPSLWSRIERHGAALARLLRDLDQVASGPIHLVTHSMGGIIARLALAEYLPQNRGGMVMLTPPNRGSHLARQFAPFVGRIFAPVLQLSSDVESFVAKVPVPNQLPVGIIAAATDFLVDEPLTHLPGEADHITLPGFHSSVLWKPETARQVAHFLAHSRFARAEDVSTVEHPAAA